MLPLIVLVGPTATGKSSLAVDLALALREQGQAADVVNADSMLIYRGMDIGTAKPGAGERRGVRHHLIDIAEVTQRASVADFQSLARGEIAQLRAAGVVPILVGGSALYTRAITDHFEFPGVDEEVRAKWEAELDRVGPHELHRRLAEFAPASAAKIEPGNGRRTVRALEVLELTGGHEPTIPPWTYALERVHQFGLDLGRAELDARIDRRVEQMWAEGLVDEVRRLLDRGLRDGVTAVRAIGYRQVVDLLDGVTSEQEAVAAVQRATRTFFRKQLGWYRRDPRISWLDALDPNNVQRILSEIGLGSRSRREGVMMRRFSFHKGHGTRNDFIIVDDSYAMHELHPEFIKLLCDRHAGIGADGVIRAVRAANVREWDGDPNIWFMDYYNADGSTAEMCGNGLRVFARYLINENLVETGSFDVATRAGVKHVELVRIGLIRADVGAARIADDDVTVTHAGRSWPATKVDVGNPHAVVFLDGDSLGDLDLSRAPTWEPAEAYPSGVNVEFIRIEGPGRLAMRVHERGSGETMSCGTGVVAAARAYRERSGHDGTVEVSVPGGELTVEFDGDDASLTGPAVIFARGEYWS